MKRTISLLTHIIQYETYTQPKGVYYDTNGIPYNQEEDMEITTSTGRVPNNEEIMNKINEIIEQINAKE